MINDFISIENSIKYVKNPLKVLTVLVKNKNMVCDDDLMIIIRFFLKHHYNNILDNDLCDNYLFENLNNYPKTKKLIKNFYNNIIKKLDLLCKINKFKIAYNRNYFWDMNIINKKKYLFNLLNKIKSYNDNSIGNITFLNRFNINDKISDNDINNQEIFDRLHSLYKKLGISFFKIYKIKIISTSLFYDFSFEERINYFNYIYNCIYKKIDDIIHIFNLFDCLAYEMDNIVNPKKIDITCSDQDIDINIDVNIDF